MIRLCDELNSVLSGSERLPACYVAASGGVLSEGYGHGGPGVCLGDGKTEAEGVPSRGVSITTPVLDVSNAHLIRERLELGTFSETNTGVKNYWQIGLA